MIKKLIYYLFWKIYEANVKAEDFDNEETDGIFLEISMNDKFPGLLKSMLKGDKTRYFRATNDEARNLIKGEYLRTLFLYKKINPVNKKKLERSVKKYKFGGRYGS